MTDLKLELTLKTVTTKVTPAAWDRVDELAKKMGVRKSDIVSACLLFMPEEELARILAEQAAAVGKMPKFVQGLLRNMDKLGDAERKILRDVLSDAGDK